MRRFLYPVITLSALSLAGCAIPSASPPTRAGAPPQAGFSLPPAASEGGKAVLGHSAAAVDNLFGKPRLDVTEGPARKLQFAGKGCILDIYFYAPRSGAKAVATHINARHPDGRDANTDRCIAALAGR